MSVTDLRRVLVTGARGQLAGAIVDAFSGSSEVLAYSREDLDIANADAVMNRVSADRPDVIINCAAYNEVDAAEDHPEKSLSVNSFGVRLLARAAAEAGSTLVHYSTDFVFDGKATRPYTEEDAPNPQGVYASSKLIGEWFAMDAPRAFVLRVESLFGGPAAKSSIDRIIRAISSGGEAKAFIDRTVSPSFVDDVAFATRALLTSGSAGLFHCVNSGHCTWYELAHEVSVIMGKADQARIVGVSVADVPLRASRPQFAALANDKLNQIVEMPTWRDALRRYLSSRSHRGRGV
jgi:dTDP-4-dehydrorhamnose reductase